MSLPNPNLPVTEARLQEFYQQIKSYLGLREMPSGDMGEIVNPKPVTAKGGHRYSTEEQIVGTWIDGSTLYEKTVIVPTPQCVTDGSEVRVDYEITSWNVETGIDLNCFAKNPNSMSTVVFKGIWVSSQGYGFRCWTAHNDTTNKDYISVTNSNTSFNEHILTITIQYTKTT